MSFNEVIIFAVLVIIGATSGILFGYRAAKRGRELAPGILLALSAGILIPLLILFFLAFHEVSQRSTGFLDAMLAAFGVTFLYGIGTSLVSGPSALLACWITFKARQEP